MRNAFVIVGLLCALVGILARQREGPMRGLATALIIVGLLIVAAVLFGDAHWRALQDSAAD